MIRLEGFPAPQGPLDLHVERGEVVLLKGPNGSGKTSLLRALAGLPTHLPPRAVLVEGDDPARLPARALRDALALSPQDPRDALVGLTLDGEARLRGRALPAPLSALAARDVATLSSGESRRAALAFADAPILLLDEPTEGLDAHGRALLAQRVADARREGCVVAADHGGLLDALATRVIHLASTPDAPLLPLPRPEGPPALESDAVRLRGRDLPALRLGPGFHALAGPNGAGKTTLLLHLAGALEGGHVRVEGEAPRPGMTVRMAPAHAKDALTRESVEEELRGADPDLAAAFVPAPLHARHPLSLSGGEAQRVRLAKTLGRPAPLYLLDEPEAHLDAPGRRALRDALHRRVSEGRCVLAATHDPALLALAHARIEVGP